MASDGRLKYEVINDVAKNPTVIRGIMSPCCTVNVVFKSFSVMSFFCTKDAASPISEK